LNGSHANAVSAGPCHQRTVLVPWAITGHGFVTNVDDGRTTLAFASANGPHNAAYHQCIEGEGRSPLGIGAPITSKPSLLTADAQSILKALPGSTHVDAPNQ
jgi:hypothetical protein